MLATGVLATGLLLAGVLAPVLPALLDAGAELGGATEVVAGWLGAGAMLAAARAGRPSPSEPMLRIASRLTTVSTGTA